MAIIKPALIENKATRDAEAIIEQVPGVQVNENQISIRGGSGWSYGAGSRVLVMVDEMPMLAGDANDIKFSAIPMENIAQIDPSFGRHWALRGGSPRRRTSRWGCRRPSSGCGCGRGARTTPSAPTGRCSLTSATTRPCWTSRRTIRRRRSCSRTS